MQQIENSVHPSLAAVSGAPLDVPVLLMTGRDFLSVLEDSGVTPMLRRYTDRHVLPGDEDVPDQVTGDGALAEIVGCSAGRIGQLRREGVLDGCIVLLRPRRNIYDVRRALECVSRYGRECADAASVRRRSPEGKKGGAL